MFLLNVVIFFVVVNPKWNSKIVLAKRIESSLPSRIQRLTRRVNVMVSGYNKYFGGGLHRERIVSKNANVLSMVQKLYLNQQQSTK
jgi:hypothetical protein